VLESVSAALKVFSVNRADLLLIERLAGVVDDRRRTGLASVRLQLRLGEAIGSCTNGVSITLATSVTLCVSLKEMRAFELKLSPPRCCDSGSRRSEMYGIEDVVRVPSSPWSRARSAGC